MEVFETKDSKAHPSHTCQTPGLSIRVMEGNTSGLVPDGLVTTTCGLNHVSLPPMSTWLLARLSGHVGRKWKLSPNVNNYLVSQKVHRSPAQGFKAVTPLCTVSPTVMAALSSPQNTPCQDQARGSDCRRSSTVHVGPR